MSANQKITQYFISVSEQFFPVSQLCFCLFLPGVATAQTQEDLFMLLGQVAQHFDQGEEKDHDEGIIGGAGEGLLTALHNALLLRDGSKRKYYRTSLSHNRALQCTVLVTAVEMMLRCSAEPLADNLDLFRRELAISIPKLLNLFINWEGGETEVIRLLTISNSIKIIRRIGPLCQESTDTFVGALLNVLRGYVATPEIHVQAASAIAHLFDQQDRTARRKRVIELIQDDSSGIISTLSTAALASNDEADEILTGLFNFAVNSHIFRTKIAKRRCTILAIGKHLTSDEVENRKLALNICKCLLNDHMQTTAEPARIDANHELLITKVMQSATAEKEPMLQLYAISLLADAVKNVNLLPAFVQRITDTLKDLVDSDGIDDVVIEASSSYCKAAAAMKPEEIPEEVLVNTADFTTLPFARTRTHALSAIESFISDENLARLLLSRTEMLDNFALIVSYGSPADAVDATNIICLLARNTAHQTALCQNKSFLNALIRLVTQEEIIDRASYAGGIESVLSLLSNGENVRSFLPFPDLLPVLVSLANTVSDEEMKQRLVSAVVRLSSAILG